MGKGSGKRSVNKIANNFASIAATTMHLGSIDAPYSIWVLHAESPSPGCHGGRWCWLLSNQKVQNVKSRDLCGGTAQPPRMLRKLTKRHWMHLDTRYRRGYWHKSRGVRGFVSGSPKVVPIWYIWVTNVATTA